MGHPWEKPNKSTGPESETIDSQSVAAAEEYGDLNNIAINTDSDTIFGINDNSSMLENIKHLMRKTFAPNAFGGMTKFRAVVLDIEDQALSTAADAAAGGSGLNGLWTSAIQNITQSTREQRDDEATGTRLFKARIRIPEVHAPIPSPIKFLAAWGKGKLNPKLTNPVKTVLSLHPLASSLATSDGSLQTDIPIPMPGSIVWVEFEKGPSDGRLINPVITGIETMAQGGFEDSTFLLPKLSFDQSKVPGGTVSSANPNAGKVYTQEAGVLHVDAATNQYSQYDEGEREIAYIVVHTAENGSERPAVKIAKYMATSGKKASVHYHTDALGNLVSQVPEKDRAWHAANRQVDEHSIGFEQCGRARYDSHPDQLYDNSARLIAELCLKYNIAPSHVIPDPYSNPNDVDNASGLHRADDHSPWRKISKTQPLPSEKIKAENTILGHNQVSPFDAGHWDPGAGYDFEILMAKVRHYIKVGGLNRTGYYG